MKQFRKWWSRKYPRAKDFSGHEKLEIAANEGWRGALERVLKQAKQTNRGRIGVIDWIEKELENGN